MSKFKVGDKVRVINKSTGDNYESWTKNRFFPDGIIGRYNDICDYYVINGDHFKEKDLEFINEESIIKNMTLKQKFTNMFITEPKKSLIKAGLMDTEGIATDDGVKVYVGYLMMKDATFKSEVVDALVAEESK